jgi:hypothetical protein
MLEILKRAERLAHLTHGASIFAKSYWLAKPCQSDGPPPRRGRDEHGAEDLRFDPPPHAASARGGSPARRTPNDVSEYFNCRLDQMFA